MNLVKMGALPRIRVHPNIRVSFMVSMPVGEYMMGYSPDDNMSGPPNTIFLNPVWKEQLHKYDLDFLYKLKKFLK